MKLYIICISSFFPEKYNNIENEKNRENIFLVACMLGRAL